MTRQAVPEFSALRVAVVGDLIADHYVYAEPRRLSREAPVMVLRHVSESLGAGGAANVARNLRALGSQVSLFGLLGRDSSGRELRATLEGESIDCASVASDSQWTTPTKMRILAAEPRRFPQQVLRIDREPSEVLDGTVAIKIAAGLRARLAEFDALVISDYQYGLVGDAFRDVSADFIAEGKIVVLDPRQHLASFAGITAITPNVGELARFTGCDEEALDDVAELRRAARQFREQVPSRWLLVTRGNMGMALFGEGLPDEGVAVEASGQGEVTDVSGAGDSAASVFALALAAGLDAQEAMRLANTASGIVVMENGTAVCTSVELESALATSPAPTKLSRPSF
jgi:rfaE bifunctional protein kinase chain/domain